MSSMQFLARIQELEQRIAELEGKRSVPALEEQIATSYALKVLMDERIESVVERIKKLEDRTARTLAYEKARAEKNG